MQHKVLRWNVVYLFRVAKSFLVSLTKDWLPVCFNLLQCVFVKLDVIILKVQFFLI